MKGPSRSLPTLPWTSGWYWLLLGLGVGSTAALFANLGPFLGWADGDREPVRWALLTAAVLWLPVTWPWVLLALLGLAALAAGWLAYTDPVALARWALHLWPADTLATTGRLLRDLWLGSYQGLPPSLRTAGTVVAAAFHLALVYHGARQPRRALWPVVGGALALVVAWFYGHVPGPSGRLNAYLVLALAFVSVAQAATPVGADTLRSWAVLMAAPAGGAPDRPGRRFPRRRLGLRFFPGHRGPAPATGQTLEASSLQGTTAPGRWAWRLTLQATALLTVTAILAGVLPPRRQPLDWLPLTQTAQRLLPFTAAQQPGGWGLVPGSQGGAVAQRQFLGGPFFPDHRPLLTVTVTGSQIPTQLYLRHVSRVTYDGRSWGEPHPGGVWAPTGYGARDLWMEAAPERRAGRRIVQQMVALQPTAPGPLALLQPRTVQGQAVPGSRREALRTGAPAVRTVDDTLIWTRRGWERTRYTVESWVPVFDPAAIRQAADRAPQASPPAPPVVPGVGPQEEPGVWSGLAAYVQLPPTLPRRVRDLARNLTAGLDNPYDQALAIEAYLRQFPYDPVMPYTPPGRDFVDYFLFDLRRGYCVAFASAAVVMLRSIGLPARWVEGFIVPTGGQPGTYTVTYAQAHAWPEVWIPGYGWVPLEPTPAYPTRPLAPPATAVAEQRSRPADAPSPTPPDPVIPLPEEAPAPPVPGTAPATADSDVDSRKAAAAAVAASLLALGAAVALRWRQRRRALLRRSPEAAIVELFVRLEGQLARLGLGRSPAQTAREYVEWLAQRLPAPAPAWFQLVDLYDRVRYGPPGGLAVGGDVPRSAASSAAGSSSAGPGEDLRRQVRLLQGRIHRDLQRALGWRYLWVRLLPHWWPPRLHTGSPRRGRRWRLWTRPPGRTRMNRGEYGLDVPR